MCAHGGKLVLPFLLVVEKPETLGVIVYYCSEELKPSVQVFSLGLLSLSQGDKCGHSVLTCRVAGTSPCLLIAHRGVEVKDMNFGVRFELGC